MRPSQGILCCRGRSAEAMQRSQLSAWSKNVVESFKAQRVRLRLRVPSWHAHSSHMILSWQRHLGTLSYHFPGCRRWRASGTPAATRQGFEDRCAEWQLKRPLPGKRGNLWWGLRTMVGDLAATSLGFNELKSGLSKRGGSKYCRSKV